jgi:hypothetical protein
VLPGCNADTSGTDSEQGMIFKKKQPENYIISSPLNGLLLNDGKPLAHKKIFRKLQWNGNEEGMIQQFMTDRNGAFSLPAHAEALTIGALSQFLGHTEIYIDHDGKREDIWYVAKMQKELNSEFDEPPQDLVCDITAEEIRVEIIHGMCMTKCRWRNMPGDNAD